MNINNQRVLIYRLGSLGDMVIALPALYLIRKAFPQSYRGLLTNIPVNNKAAAAEMILGKEDFIRDYISYPLKTRNPKELFQLWKKIVRWKPDVIIYLTGKKGVFSALRDALFFKLCGFPKLIGFPLKPSLNKNSWLPQLHCYERECSRLLRLIKNLGDVDLDDRKNWDMCFKASEINKVETELKQWSYPGKYIVCSIGAKISAKDWEKPNWTQLIQQMNQLYSKEYGLIFVGVASEYQYSQTFVDLWDGAALNLCGALTPRESAVLLKQAILFIGHDSGPMHLAAAQNVPCVAIFAARNLPGVWFPYGKKHEVLYHLTACTGCHLSVCKKQKKKCILSIRVEEAMHSVNKILNTVEKGKNER